MSKPPHLCACGKIVAHGAFCTCQIASTRARNKRYEKTRPTASKRGYNSAWRALRIAFLAAFPFCAMCKGKADVVDHIIPHRGDEVLFNDRNNLQALCTPCHNRHKQRSERNT